MTRLRSFTAGGATLVIERRGGGHPAYLLVHGIGMGRGVFGDLIGLLDAAAEVVALDLPGYGEAPEPARVLTMERTADVIAAYLRAHVDEPVIAVGHSMGAQIVLELAVRHRELVRALVLVGPSGDPSARSALHQIGRIVRDILGENPRVIGLGGREYLRAGPHLRGKFRAMLSHRPEDVLHRVAVPTLVLRGENDRVAPRAWCERIVAGIPDARLEQVPDRRHETMIRDAAPAVALIERFVRSLPALPA